MKKKKKLTGQQIKFIINIFSLIIFAFSYLYIYTKLETMKDETYQEISIVKKYIETMKDKEIKKDAVVKDTEDKKGQIQKVLDSYPVNITKVDNLLFVEQMGKELDITFSNVNATDSISFFNTILPMRNADGTEIPQPTADTSDKEKNTASPTPKADDAAAGSNKQTKALDEIEAETAKDTAATNKPAAKDDKTAEPTTMTGLESTVTMSFETTVDGFIKLVDYINNYPSKTVIDSVSLSVDPATNLLSGSLVVKRYALAGTGKVYEAPKIDDISVGTEDIFGIGSGASEEPAPTAAPDETQMEAP